MNDQERLRRDRVIRDGKVNNSIRRRQFASRGKPREQAIESLNDQLIAASNALNTAMLEAMKLASPTHAVLVLIRHATSLTNDAREMVKTISVHKDL
jgi:hypothetical protein